ncbi:hypothetical protein PC129_g18208 [Phytophthora cactorum]|uniref:Uncharacterized protein n=1 Tax=Phytophthora cactorum TaxID=29920 RepID=A0A8T1JTC0_9STRA|nr:hypothetical protein Pcac1_g25445 [Phytophthora cactorum]KAG2881808.1 hypothetical protein PC114_g21382 [Phytophthora cactorum]KAG2903553.1 hypothetical protein PC117_g21231 [Phytophthora cactorum]KAG2966409.1 hypothetical protein PC118_g19200 [Phytophthora cactorum]KAG2982505.1 hypothetical protein PC119_g20833 [Phytophthora cactorum]
MSRRQASQDPDNGRTRTAIPDSGSDVSGVARASRTRKSREEANVIFHFRLAVEAASASTSLAQTPFSVGFWLGCRDGVSWG